MARAGDFRNWNSHRADRRASLFPMAVTRRTTCQSGLAAARELFLYACKIKETTNGSRRCACGETRQEVEVVAQGRIEPNGEVDERRRATENGKDEAQRETHTQKQEKIELVFLRLDSCTSLRPLIQAEESTGGKKKTGPGEAFHPPALSLSIAALALFKGSKLTLLVPVKG